MTKSEDELSELYRMIFRLSLARKRGASDKELRQMMNEIIRRSAERLS
jgi:hypothetical protein